MNKHVIALGIIVSLAYFISSKYLEENVAFITSQDSISALYEEELIVSFEQQKLEFISFQKQIGRLLDYYQSIEEAFVLYSNYASDNEITNFLLYALEDIDSAQSLSQDVPIPKGFRDDEKEDFSNMKVNLASAFEFLRLGYEEYHSFRSEGGMIENSQYHILQSQSKTHFSKVKQDLEKYNEFFHRNEDVAITSLASEHSIEFEIINDIIYRYDHGVTYYVLLESEDTMRDNELDIVKKVVSELVEDVGSKISIEFFTNKKALSLHFKANGDFSLKRPITYQEKQVLALHHLATFFGELETGKYINSLSMYPSASMENQVVGELVQTIKYNP